LGAPLALVDYGADADDLGERTVLGANMAVRRDVIARLGGFAPHLGKLRGTLLSGEDHELCRRVQAAGYRARYCPPALVHHWVPADRARVGYFLNWFYWSGITHATLEDVMPGAGRSRAAALPPYLLKRSAFAALRVLGGLAAGRRTAALDAAVDIAFAAGYAAQRLGWIKHLSSEPSKNAGELACR
jgi:cellulose synthase/poly-beta-1,6-N-acetylglucosamine synthase-like glycosyltransferase